MARWKRTSWTQEGLRVLEGGEHPRDLLRHGGQVVAGGALGGEARRRHLQHAPRVEHVVAREPVQRGHQAEGTGGELRRARGDEAARAVAGLDDAHRGQGAQAGADRRPAHLDLARELALGRQPVPGLELPGLDQLLDVHDDALRGQRVVGRRGDAVSYVGSVIGHTSWARPFSRVARMIVPRIRSVNRNRSSVAGVSVFLVADSGRRQLSGWLDGRLEAVIHASVLSRQPVMRRAGLAIPLVERTMADDSAVTRREFMVASGTAAAASMLAGTTGLAAPAPARRVALVGTGIRGTTMWGKDVVARYSDVVEFVGLCDVNPLRVGDGEADARRELPDLHEPRRRCSTRSSRTRSSSPPSTPRTPPASPRPSIAGSRSSPRSRW